MKRKVLKTAAYSLGIALLVISLFAFTTSEKASYQVVDHPDWENLKVLPQDISKDSLKGLMKGYSKSLGVKCNYCHAQKKDNPDKLNFASDKKEHKLVARGMIKMTNEINANYFKPYYDDPKPKQVHDVKCIMCHRGNPNPEEYLGDVHSFYKKESEEKDED